MNGTAARIEQLKQVESPEDLLVCLDSWNTQPALLRVHPTDAVFAQTLVDTVVPHAWLATNSSSLTHAIVQALSSVTGISALLAHIRTRVELSLIKLVLESPRFTLAKVHNCLLNSSVNKQLGSQVWSAYVVLLAGSRLLNGLAPHKTRVELNDFWFTSPEGISRYLCEGICELLLDSQRTCAVDTGSIGKLLLSMQSLSPFDDLYTIIVKRLASDNAALTILRECIRSMGHGPACRSLQDLMNFLAKRHFMHDTSSRTIDDDDRIGSAATFMSLFCAEGDASDPLTEWLLNRSSGVVLPLRRAAVAVLAQSKSFFTVVERVLAIWGDKLHVTHASQTARRTTTENLLLSLGRLSPVEQQKLARSSMLTQGISHHLDSSSESIRAQGMIVAEVMSEMAERSARLKFDLDVTTGADSAFLRSLVHVQDCLRPLTHLERGTVEVPDDKSTMSAEPSSSIIVEEVNHEVDHEVAPSTEPDDGMQTYGLPDSDDDDSEDDPTLIDRDTIPRPLYIRALLDQLNQHDSFKNLASGLRHAPDLIRRKMHYGTELVNYATNLAETLCGIKDNFDMDDFQELRQEALVTLVTACPHKVGPYLSRAFFVADYSLQQRIILLSAMALGSHRIASSTQSEGASNLRIASLDLGPRLSTDTITQNGSTSPASISSAIADAAGEYRATWQASLLFPLLGNFRAYMSQLMPEAAATLHDSMLMSFYVKTVASVYQHTAMCVEFKAMTTEVLQFACSLQSQRDPEVCATLAGLVYRLLEMNDSRTLIADHSGFLHTLQDWSVALADSTNEPQNRFLFLSISMKISEFAEDRVGLLMAGSSSVMQSAGTRFGLRGLQ